MLFVPVFGVRDMFGGGHVLQRRDSLSRRAPETNTNRTRRRR